MSFSDAGSLSITRPADGAIAITPSDNNNLSRSVRALYVGVSGDVKITFIDDTEVTFVALAAGVIHPMRAKKVFSTGTTATGIVGIL